MGLSHINNEGRANMVDVSDKTDTLRIAEAVGSIHMKKETLERIINGGIKKGDVLAVSQVAGIMAAKNTSNIIPMCHPLLLTSVDISFSHDFESCILTVKSTVSLTGKTGVEMEALTAVNVALLTVYDMCKAIDKDMIIKEVKLLSKSGGRSGEYRRDTNG
ncbi:cyclic pyranopterin monophosphate synthase MoaC [Candidatus Izimaplasma bacterium]|nr:cyclic pyranopterin monophosphate synthase MoaC [Candidatus Izimaplasma bacterium]